MWLANKLKRQDSASHLDEWRLTEISGCAHRLTNKMAVSDKEVVKSVGHIVLIPFGSYVDYDTWKTDTTSGYSLSVGDIVFFENPGIITADNITELKNSKRSIEVREFFVVEKKFDTRFQIKIVG